MTAYLQHLTMYSIYTQSSLLLIGYSASWQGDALLSPYPALLPPAATAILRRALAVVTNGNSPLFSHFSYNSFEVDRRKKRPSSIVCVCPLTHV